MDELSHWIALVDDEEAVRRALLRLMRSMRLEARVFASGNELIAELANGKPYCVVLDLHMPGMSGFDVQAWLASNAPEIQVIVATGQHSAEVQTRAMLTKPLAYLHKPMDAQLLLDAVALAGQARAQVLADVVRAAEK